MSILITALALSAIQSPAATQHPPAEAPGMHAQHSKPAAPGAKAESKGCCCKTMAAGGKMACCAEHGKGQAGAHSGHSASH